MMPPFTLTEIEQSLLPYRAARRRVRSQLLEYMVSSEHLTNPFLLLSRLFIRLKSADSILEKMQRKGLVVQSAPEIGQVMDDLLGVRIITENLEELWALDQFLKGTFEVKSRLERIDLPGRFGYRSIEYALVYHGRDTEVPFEVQLRTLLQHYWASCSFHLFHKAAPSVAAKYEKTLISLSQDLRNAEKLAALISATRKKPAPLRAAPPNLDMLPIHSEVHLVLMEHGERFAKHSKLTMSGNDLHDHQAIVDQKLALYAEYPGSAIVECTCMNFSTFVLNEPHVEIPPERLDRIVW